MATIFTGSYSENFDTLANTGTSATLPSEWILAESGTNANVNYTAGTGSGNAGDTYSFGLAGDTERALGGLRSGSLTPLFGTSFTNSTGNPLTSFTVGYRGEQWRLGATTGRADRLDFQYSLNATSLTTGAWVDVDALDFSSPVTSGTVGSLNGNMNSTTLSTVIAGLNIAAGETFWFRWQDFDPVGSDDGLAIDDFSLNSRPTLPPLTPTVAIAANPASTTEGNAISGVFTISRTGDTTNPLTVNFTTGGTATSGNDYLTPASFATNSIEIPAGQSSVTIGINAIDDNDVEVVENVTVTLNASASYSVGTSNTAAITLNDNDAPIPITLISQIQGSGTAATAGTFTIEGIVVGDFQDPGQLGGFYLQEEDTDADGSVLTSEGIFVNSLVRVNVGEKVRLTGTVQENSSAPSFNQAVITPTSTQILGSGFQSLVTATAVDLPTTTLGDLERYEGMLVTFPEALTVTEVFNLGRFGEVVLSANGRLFNPTNFIDPNDNSASGNTSTGNSNVGAVTAQQDLNDRSRIILDDGSSLSNLSDVPYINTTDANPLNDTLRIGSTTTGLTGVLGFGFNAYRIQSTQAPIFDYAARPDVPTVGGNVKVGSFNVLNYFNGDGLGGGFPTSRGADSAAEFSRQRAKIITAIDQLNADVVGLIEVENDGDGPNSAIADLVSGLNAVAGSGTYAFVPLATTTGSSGTDEIKVAFIYKPGAVTPVGNAIYFNDPAFNSARPPLAQTFSVNTTGETFTPIVNHFKSKASAATLPGDTDQGDGQGLSNATRKAQSTALLSFISQIQTTSGDSDVMVIGDLNAYNEEDPIDILRAGGLTKLATGSESYVFNGQTGSLDHALVTSSLLSQVTGAAKWNINADEPITLDYNDDIVTTPGESSTEDRNDITLYAPTPFRSSDHDPVLVGLNLVNPNTAPTAVNFANTIVSLAENTSTTIRIQVASVSITDDGFGTNVLSLSGVDSSFFELDGSALFLKANTSLNFEDKFSYAVTVAVDDASVGTTPDASANFTLAVTNVNEAPIAINDSGFTANQSMAKLISIATLLANDTDPDANTTLSILPDGFSDVVGGTVALNGGNVVFTPGSSFSGTANFKYTLSDGSLTSQAIVTLQVGRTVNGGNGKDTLTGNDGDDNLNGGNGEDTLFGNGGNDILLGGNGNDKLFGGQGNNTLTGGNGADTFVLDSFAGTSTITDFTDGQDKIGLPGGLSFGQLNLLQGSGSNLNNALVTATSNGVNYTLGILQGVSAGSLSSTDFISV